MRIRGLFRLFKNGLIFALAPSVKELGADEFRSLKWTGAAEKKAEEKKAENANPGPFRHFKNGLIFALAPSVEELGADELRSLR